MRDADGRKAAAVCVFPRFPRCQLGVCSSPYGENATVLDVANGSLDETAYKNSGYFESVCMVVMSLFFFAIKIKSHIW
jgi:hypothetical protein